MKYITLTFDTYNWNRVLKGLPTSMNNFLYKIEGLLSYIQHSRTYFDEILINEINIVIKEQDSKK